MVQHPVEPVKQNWQKFIENHGKNHGNHGMAGR
jgi:hypothetical protein